MNSIMEEQGPVLEQTQALRYQLMEILTDEELGYSPGGENPTLGALCREMGEKPADVALVWLLHNPDVMAPIIGLRALEQLEGAARALEVELTTSWRGWTRSSPVLVPNRPRLTPGE